MLSKGLVQIYTGTGKGKTTASFGLALRAAGWGNKVIIYQFLKPASLKLGERKAVAKSQLAIKIVPLKIEWNMKKSLDDGKTIEKTRQQIALLFEKIQTQAKNREYDIIILDEIVFCLTAKLVALDLIKDLIKSKAKQVELILTGQGATKELIKLADLVTEMKLIKHPFEKKINARKGIEF
ncbi:MAG: cob(I)yrinic acid a,c-diamide adenosyltransferase [Planctomycetaceae bacterium]|nr:cob(I)yrinic acid a,c-diamide adenosyltransferase [Planctomycetaceae bacterium]